VSYQSVCDDLELAESVNWPLVSASPGYSAIDNRWREPATEPVLAWRVGPRLTLPVTRHGFDPRETWIEYPDGSVRHHGLPAPSAVPDFGDFAAWRLVYDEAYRILDAEPADAFPFAA
jgi:hypothetical protein